MSDKLTPGPSVESYEKILEIRFIGMKKSDLKKGGNFNFIVTPEYNIHIAREFHHRIAQSTGTSTNQTLTEGYIQLRQGKSPQILFKGEYQPQRAYDGSPPHFDMFKSAVKKKILSQLQD